MDQYTSNIRKLAVIAALLSAATIFCFTGCEVNSNATESSGTNEVPTSTGTSTNTTPTPVPVTTNTTPTTPTTYGDELDISSAVMLGPHKDMVAQRAAITRAMYSANIEGDKVKMSFETLNWPEKSGSKVTDGAVYIFWITGGQVIGGYFDAHSVGQTTKGLENIYGGYLDGQQPPKGSTVYFALVSYDVKQRTNTKRSNTTW